MRKKATRKRPYFTMESVMTAILRDASGKMHHGILFARRNALLSQRKTLIGSSMEICQHLSKTRQPLSTLDIITIYRTNN